ncbi:arylsulfatase B-like [Ptychodera flava]|uniref:arylsulfatase B-like n=1 Tax=Ptychodera flava TaxID=63121 RepID=UPI00396A42DF
MIGKKSRELQSSAHQKISYQASMKLVIVFVALFLGTSCAFPERHVRSSSSSSGSSEKKKQPHIVFLLSDNSGWADVEWNDPVGVMKTPNMNDLARNGVILNQTYVQPVCTPTRAAFMTGYYPFRYGLGHAMIMPAQPMYLSKEYKLLPEYLKELGYTNHIVGKWHLGFCRWDVTPLERGFDSHFGIYNGLIDYYTQSVSIFDPVKQLFGQDPGETGLDFQDNTGSMFHHQGTHASEHIGKRAVDLIERHNPDVPMFLYMSFLLPHFPFQAPDRFTNMYAPLPVPGLQQYRGMISMIDEAIGNITNALKANDMYEDTVIVYLSDNGGPWFFGTQWPLRGAGGSPFEGGIRSPGFVHSPWLEKTGYVNNEVIHISDFFPTILSLAGGEPDPNLDGVDVWETISKNKPSTRTTTVLHYDTHPVSPCTSIRVGRYKIIDGRYDVVRNITFNVDNLPSDTWFPPPELQNPDVPNVQAPKVGTQLFDIEADPREINNLADSMPEKVAELLQIAADITAGSPEPWYPNNVAEVANPNEFFNGTWTPGWC